MSDPSPSFARHPFAVRLFRALVVALCVTASTLAAAQAGQLDSSFASKGIFSDSFNTSPAFATSVALQIDGKIVVGGEAGNFGVVVRLNSNGTLDKSFGSGGMVSIRFRDVQNFTTSVAIQSDGKIVVAGTGLPGGGQLDRLNSDGSFDTSFGTGGVVGLGNTPGVLALQTDGKILLTGAGGGGRVIQRYETTGQLDTTFGNAGTAPLVGEGAIALQSDGKILVSSSGLTLPAGVAARYNTNGSIDKSFGILGQAAIVAGAGAVAVQTDGRIVTAGTVTSQLSLSGNTLGFGLERFNSNGSIDATFGTRGGVSTTFSGFPFTGANALLIQSNGDIVAAGEAGNNGGSQLVESFALARYLSSGKLDTTFGTGGLVTTSFGSTAVASISALALQPDGKIVAAGSNSQGALVVARYLGQ